MWPSFHNVGDWRDELWRAAAGIDIPLASHCSGIAATSNTETATTPTADPRTVKTN